MRFWANWAIWFIDDNFAAWFPWGAALLLGREPTICPSACWIILFWLVSFGFADCWLNDELKIPFTFSGIFFRAGSSFKIKSWILRIASIFCVVSSSWEVTSFNLFYRLTNCSIGTHLVCLPLASSVKVELGWALCVFFISTIKSCTAFNCSF